MQLKNIQRTIEFETLRDDYNSIEQHVNKIWLNLSRQIFAQMNGKVVGSNVHVLLNNPCKIDGVCVES